MYQIRVPLSERLGVARPTHRAHRGFAAIFCKRSRGVTAASDTQFVGWERTGWAGVDEFSQRETFNHWTHFELFQ